MTKLNRPPVKKQLPLFDTIDIPLSKGRIAKIDPSDADLLQFNWCVTGDRIGHPYAVRANPDGGFIHMHRVILERKLGRPLQPKECCDHIDGDGLNDKRDNLRLATYQQNTQNKKRAKRIASGYKGAYWHAKSRKWTARIRVNDKLLLLGYFDTPEAAHAAYCVAAVKYFGEFARFE